VVKVAPGRWRHYSPLGASAMGNRVFLLFCLAENADLESSTARKSMIPLRDTERSYSPPIITVLLIAANAAMFFYELSLDPWSRNHLIAVYGVVPDHLPNA
jgi:hypothetical protein